MQKYNLLANFCLGWTSNFDFFLKSPEIVAELLLVKSRYLDTCTCDFARKYFISSGLSQQKISESFMYVA